MAGHATITNRIQHLAPRLQGLHHSSILANSGTDMSRLESMIRRLQAQVTCLDAAMAAIDHMPGPIFELGLGNGRTFDHLRERAKGREIFVFERQLNAHPDCIPDSEHLILGNLEKTLPPLVAKFAGSVALIHADLGTADARYPDSLETLIAGIFPELLAPGGLVLTDKPITVTALTRAKLPEGVPKDRYFIYRLQN